MKYKASSLSDVAQAIKHKKQQTNVVFIVGAGISVTAGVPTTASILTLLRVRFSHIDFDAVREPNYGKYMAKLTEEERRDFLGEVIDGAKINFAHLYLGNLVKNQISDTILTPNFDPLIEQSLYRFNLFPAIYDFALSQKFQYSKSVKPCVIHLNGQRHGFTLLNTSRETRRIITDNLRKLFRDTFTNSICVIVGYSGQNDPILDVFNEVKDVFERCFWIAYMDHEPEGHELQEFVSGSRVFYVNGFDADSFFYDLNGALELSKPDFLLRPFSSLEESLKNLKDYSGAGIFVSEIETAREWVKRSINYFEERDKHYGSLSHYPKMDLNELAETVKSIVENDLYYQIDKVFYQVLECNVPYSRRELAEGLYNFGLDLLETAIETRSSLRGYLLGDACAQFNKSTQLIDKNYKAYNNWGLALIHLADIRYACAEYLGHAISNLKKALEINPNHYNSIVNLGRAYLRLSYTKGAVEAQELLTRAREHFQLALSSADHASTAHNFLGHTFMGLANLEENRERKLEAFRTALESYASSHVNSLKPSFWDRLSEKIFSIYDNYFRLNEGEQRSDQDLNKALESLETDCEWLIGVFGELGDMGRPTETGFRAFTLYDIGCDLSRVRSEREWLKERTLKLSKACLEAVTTFNGGQLNIFYLRLFAVYGYVLPYIEGKEYLDTYSKAQALFKKYLLPDINIDKMERTRTRNWLRDTSVKDICEDSNEIFGARSKSEALYTLAKTWIEYAEHKEGQDGVDEVLAAAMNALSQCVTEEPDSITYLSKYAEALLTYSEQQKSNPEKIKTLEECISTYKRLLRLGQSDYPLYTNMGAAIYFTARLESDHKARIELIKSAIELFEKALVEDGVSFEANFYSARASIELFQLGPPIQNAESLLVNAESFLRKSDAFQLSPKVRMEWLNLYGVVVFNLAQHKTGLERTRLLETSVGMFIDSLKIRRDQLRVTKYLYVLFKEVKSLPKYESRFAESRLGNVLKGIDESVNLSDILFGSRYLKY
jgi:tetratricopeptide (TPR) repeat protein